MAQNTATVPRPRGRPRVSQPGTSVSTWLTPQEADKLIQLANKREQSVSALVRLIVVSKLGQK